MFISLIFPCHNEEQAIPQVLPKAIQAKNNLLKSIPLKGFEILVVDDASQDHSLERLKEYEREIQIISLETQEGYGSAIQKGIQQAQGDWIAFCDLDNSCEPEELKLLIDSAKQGNRQSVWGNRLNKNSCMPWTRSLGNRLYQLLFLLLTFRLVPDACSGFRLFKKSTFLPQIYQFPQDLSFSLVFTAYCVRYKIPFSTKDISYSERLGKSKLHLFKDGLIFCFNLLNFLFFKKIK